MTSLSMTVIRGTAETDLIRALAAHDVNLETQPWTCIVLAPRAATPASVEHKLRREDPEAGSIEIVRTTVGMIGISRPSA